MIGLILSVGWADASELQKSDAPDRTFWRVGKPVPIAVRQGRASFRAPARTAGSESLVVVSSLSREKGPFSVQLAARPGEHRIGSSLAVDGLPACVRAQCSGYSTTRGSRPSHDCRIRPGHLLRTSPRACAGSARERVFHMLVRDGDVYSPSNYVAVPAVLRGVGRRIQVYVAREDLDVGGSRGVGDIINAFDDRIFPADFESIRTRAGRRRRRSLHGPSLKLARSPGRGPFCGRRIRQSGRSRPHVSPAAGKSMRRDVPEHLARERAVSPHGAGTRVHARGSVRSKGPGHGRLPGAVQEEEGWLDEAIAHLAEDCCGFSTANIDYRVRCIPGTVPNDISLSWTTITQPTCSGATVIVEARICS